MALALCRGFLFKTVLAFFSYNIMIRLLPTTDEQEFNIRPRFPERIYDLSLTITEEATNKSETISVSAFDNGNEVCVSGAFSFLKENYTYFVSITSDGELWYRSKALVTSHVAGDATKQSIRNGSDDGFNELEKSPEFEII